VVTSTKTKQVVAVLNAAIQVVEAPPSRGTREICAYDRATLSAGPQHPHWEYVWSTGARSPIIDVTRTGTYWITIRLKGGNCQVTDTFHVKVMPKPSLSLGTERNICAGDKLNLSVSDPTNSYQIRWMPGNSDASSFQFLQNTPGIYRVAVRVTGCEVHTAEIKVKVNDCRIAIPNVFTPNGDGVNDLFVITGLDSYPASALVVADRNGRVVFESNDYQNDWNGQDFPDGTYFYTLLPGGNPELARKGTINIRR
jgi:gliding motility-associated-like protein